MIGTSCDFAFGHSGGLETSVERSRGLRIFAITSSYVSGITNGDDCGGMVEASGSGGNASGVGSGVRGCSRKGSNVFRNDVKMSDRSSIESNGRSRLIGG